MEITPISTTVTSRKKPVKATHWYKIKGNIFELHISYGTRRDKLYRRFFVSPEFIQLFYFLHDGTFDNRLYESLSDKERQEMSSVMSYLNIDNQEFNIALAKSMRNIYERFKVIEGAIKAGNLSTELHDEYVGLMNMLSKMGMIPSITANKNIKSIGRTLSSQSNKNIK